MKKYVKGLIMSLGMFSAVPLPTRSWDESCAKMAMPCLPIVGCAVGFFWWGAAKLLMICGARTAMAAAALALAPFLVTGFIHLDGYMDTSDAVLSRRPLEEKLRILKDPHAGAFAVIMVAVLFTLQFASCFAIAENGKYLAMLAAIPVISRCCSGLSVLCLKAMAENGYASMFKKNTGASHKIFIAAAAVAATSMSYICAGIFGLAVVASVVLGHSAAMTYAYREFNGISGDLAGFSLVIGEVCGLAALASI